MNALHHSKKIEAPDRNLNYELVQQSITKQIREYVATRAKKDTCVIGISGGIDSALVSTLCAQTDLTTLLVSLPLHQNPQELDRANLHIQDLQEKYSNTLALSLDLTSSFEVLKKSLLNLGGDEKNLELTLENIRSRLRMTALYGIAQLHDGLVIGTGNLIEDYGVGFFTKYGDGGVDYNPIGALYKSEVRNLAQTLGINDTILHAKPTAGLHIDNSNDEDQLGANYNELERAMVEYNKGKRYKDYLPDTREVEVMKIYTRRHESNAHKLHMPPIAQIPGIDNTITL